MKQKIKVRLVQGMTNSIIIGREMRQECRMTPILYNFYAEWLVKKEFQHIGIHRRQWNAEGLTT